jgi:hypothetical protein
MQRQRSKLCRLTSSLIGDGRPLYDEFLKAIDKPFIRRLYLLPVRDGLSDAFEGLSSSLSLEGSHMAVEHACW